MPRLSRKHKFLRELEGAIWLEQLESKKKDDWMDSFLREQGEEERESELPFPKSLATWPGLKEAYMYYELRRRLEWNEPVPKSSSHLSLLARVDVERFRQEVRMSRRAFEHVLRCIAGDPVFKNETNSQQAPVEKQLHLALHRFGCHGNAISIGKVARQFGVSEGTAINYTNRVITALLALRRRYLCWYKDDVERSQVKQRIREKSGFPHCLGAVDGTEIVLAKRPVNDAKAYFTRKQRYAYNAQIIVDDTCRIRFYSLGFPGSVNDSRAFGVCRLATQPERMFHGEEYILADKAYALTPTVITPYKGNAAREPENVQFNYLHSTVRIATEHTIGQLKGRFGSLRGLCIRVRDEESHEKGDPVDQGLLFAAQHALGRA
jgi:hypothetical protein